MSESLPFCRNEKPCGARRNGKCCVLTSTDFGKRDCPFRKDDFPAAKIYKMKPGDLDTAQQMRMEGKTAIEIAWALGCSRATVASWVHKGILK